MNRQNDLMKLQKTALIIGVILLIIKIIAWRLTHSTAVLSDALESIINVVAAALGLFSIWYAARPYDKEHPYGHGKVEYISAGIEGVLVIFAGFGIIYESVSRLFNPIELENLDWGIGLTALSGIINFALGWTMVKKGKDSESMVLISGGKHLQADAWSTISLFVGLVFIQFLGFVVIDSVMAIVFGGWILFSGYKVVKSAIKGIMDEQDFEMTQQVLDFLNENRDDSWIDLHNFRMVKYGHSFHIDCHLTMPWYASLQQSHDKIDKMENMLIEKFNDRKVEMFIHMDPCSPLDCPQCALKDCAERKSGFNGQKTWTLKSVRGDRGGT